MWKKNKIPSTILFKLVAHSSTEDLIIVVVDWVDEPKPDKGAFFFLPILQFLFHLHIEFLAGGSISLPWPETKGSRWRAVNAAAVPTPILLPANIRVRLWSLRWPHWRREAARERAPTNVTGKRRAGPGWRAWGVLGAHWFCQHNSLKLSLVCVRGETLCSKTGDYFICQVLQLKLKTDRVSVT